MMSSLGMIRFLPSLRETPRPSGRGVVKDCSCNDVAEHACVSDELTK